MTNSPYRSERQLPFQEMASAPRDGSIIEVKYGSRDEVALAFWSVLDNAFVRDSDPLRRSLFQAYSWRPVEPHI